MASSSLSTMISICSERVLNFATVRLAEENSEPTSGSDWRNPGEPMTSETFTSFTLSIRLVSDSPSSPESLACTRERRSSANREMPCMASVPYVTVREGSARFIESAMDAMRCSSAVGGTTIVVADVSITGSLS